MGFSRRAGCTNLGTSPTSDHGQDEPGGGFRGKRDETNTIGSRDQNQLIAPQSKIFKVDKGFDYKKLKSEINTTK